MRKFTSTSSSRQRRIVAPAGREEAWRRARIRFGGVGRIKESTRDQFRPVILEQSVRDVRDGFRVLRSAPAFSLAALVTLGLGIGANATLFSIINAVLLRPLPYPASDRLVWVHRRGNGCPHRLSADVEDARNTGIAISVRNPPFSNAGHQSGSNHRM
jgi:putative ABC transport system permease protein